VLVQTAAPSGTSVFQPKPSHRTDLQFIRASGLAQARLQVAVLSGNRRRALEQIDRLVAIDKELERLINEGGTRLNDPTNLESDLADARLALASEKLALTSEIQMPRLEPAFGAGMTQVLELDDAIEVIEDATIRTWAIRLLIWASGFIVLGAGVVAAALTQA
jgi:hypothetical protein